MQYFTFYQKENALAFTRLRNGETKLGQTVVAVSNPRKWQQNLAESNARFAVIGIPEDIGVRANYGSAGTSNAWPSFLDSFFNLQENAFISGSNLVLLGYFDFPFQADNLPAEALREAVAKIDTAVSALVRKVVECGKIPILIGGGHNNAYGAIKGSADGLFARRKLRAPKINVVSLDAHADLRPLEGRHSGNAFSYAFQEKRIRKYGVFGLHENYLTKAMQEILLRNKNIRAVYFEDVFVRNVSAAADALAAVLDFTSDSWCGVEIDLDGVENVPASASAPSGVTSLFARQFVHAAAFNRRVAYLHICEGIARPEYNTGKLIACLVSDFIKAIR
jgi:formiminoglutamase